MTSLGLLVIYLNLTHFKTPLSEKQMLIFKTLMLNTNLSKKQKLTKQQEFKIFFIDISEKKQRHSTWLGASEFTTITRGRSSSLKLGGDMIVSMTTHL